MLLILYEEIILCSINRQGQYSDAIMLLNKAIADNQFEQGLYINRGGNLFIAHVTFDVILN